MIIISSDSRLNQSDTAALLQMFNVTGNYSFDLFNGTMSVFDSSKVVFNDSLDMFIDRLRMFNDTLDMSIDTLTVSNHTLLYEFNDTLLINLLSSGNFGIVFLFSWALTCLTFKLFNHF